MPYSTITSKGQITIPKEICDQLHLKIGDRIEFDLKDREVILKPISKKSIEVFGILKDKTNRSVSIEEMDTKQKEAIAEKWHASH